MAGPNPKNTDTCSFCGKPRGKVTLLIAGPLGVFICDECVDLCNEIIADLKSEGEAPSRR